MSNFLWEKNLVSYGKTNNFCGNQQLGARVYFHVLILYAVVEYPCEAKHFDLTPNRKKIISYTKKHYRPAAKRITTSNDISEHADITLITQQMHKEMSKLCSIEHHSILQDTHEGIKRFRWQTIWLEYQSKVPTLFAFYLAYFLKMIKSW